jgi:hypothetical protein
MTGGNEADDFTTVMVLPTGYPVLESLSPETGDVIGGEQVDISGVDFNFTSDHILVQFGSSILTSPTMITIVKPLSSCTRHRPSLLAPRLGENIYGPTSIDFGPDGKLYVGTLSGIVVKLALDEKV